MREVDLQRRDGDEACFDRMKVGAFAGVRCGAGGADPVADLAARRLGLDYRLRLVPPAETGDAIALDVGRRTIRNIDVEQPLAERLVAVVLQQFSDHRGRGSEVTPDLAGERHREGRDRKSTRLNSSPVSEARMT